MASVASVPGASGELVSVCLARETTRLGAPAPRPFQQKRRGRTAFGGAPGSGLRTPAKSWGQCPAAKVVALCWIVRLPMAPVWAGRPSSIRGISSRSFQDRSVVIAAAGFGSHNPSEGEL